ncbi:GNAT family N-acetyltransferase [Alteribacter keqinensis]|uniref:GNAT family N-acetyltransferase n=1 Tax=Alteribacter keqinensis TaxID=2483800 RepID=A0A3M7TNR9_9BACI|nr:GNAT family N-acetyltransferase [Alteribacter keqinensis]RNA66894.1 GNAT family N-acetyltransferase [Alteribacter keqinensis]
MIIRIAKQDDAEKLIDLIRQVESEADFMLMEAGERNTTAEQQRKQIEHLERQTNSTILVAEDAGTLAGYLFAIGGSAKRTKHAAYLVIGILKAYRGQGVGTRLFQEVEKWARDNNVSRLELTAVTENKAGVALYKKSGFDVEGMKRQTLLINGEYYDEYVMGKVL